LANDAAVMPPKPRYSLIVPFFNEEANVGPMLAEVRLVMERLGAPYEVLAIDDGSRDRTPALLDEIAAGWPACRVFHFARNCQQAAALYFALQRAEGEIIITLDGDRQNDPADIPRLLDKLADADLVVGIRAHRQDSWLRRQMSRLANAVRSRILHDGLHDAACGLKVFRREVIPALIPIHMLQSLLGALAVAAGFRVTELPVNHRPRPAGESKYGLGILWWKPAVDMLGVCWFTRRRLPLKIELRDAGKGKSSR